jgi:metal-responsive CopG/Arc/MetJ family transcriptional regulator
MHLAKINVSIPEDFLSEIDRYKKIKKVTRSQFLINAASVYFDTIESELASERKKNAVNKLRKTRQDIMKLISGKHDINVVEELREMRLGREKEIEKRAAGK